MTAGWPALPARLALAQRPTPIQMLPKLSGHDLPMTLWVWRDDLTGCVLSGNKIRKLEFLLAEAKAQGADTVLTCGGLQSNHVRATVYAARQLGLQVVAVLRLPPEGTEPGVELTGNYLLDQLAAAETRSVRWDEFQERGGVYDPFLDAAEEDLRAGGRTVFRVPEGGSSALGCMGYRAAVAEMLATWRECGPGTEAPDTLWSAVGSGGTLGGLVLGYQEHGLALSRLHGVNVCDTAEWFADRIHGLLRDVHGEFGIGDPDAELHIHDGHVGAGYGQASDEDLAAYRDLARDTGLVVDPCYTGKAFRGMLRELERDPERFGEHVMFLHTGGLFEIFAYGAGFGRVLGQPAT